MAFRYEVQVTISSAKDLKNVNWRHGSLKPYAVVWVDSNYKCSTLVDDEGDTSPFWDQTLAIPLPSLVPSKTTPSTSTSSTPAPRKAPIKPLIGSAKLKLIDVLDDVGIGERTTRALQLKRPSGRPQGKLDVKVTIRDPRYRAPDAYREPPYGVPPPSSSRDYPYATPYGAPPPQPNPYYSTAAPPAGYPYSAPPPPTYGQQSYGYGSYGYGEQQPVVVEEKKKSKFGGMGTGLAVGAVGGVLGGLALAEGIDALEDHVADDVAQKVEDDLADDDDAGGW